MSLQEIISAHKIVVFSKSYCSYCQRAKSFFKNLGMEIYVSELDLIGDEGNILQAALIEKTEQKTVPSIFIYGKHIGGCESIMQAHADGTLYDILNNKSVTYDFDLIVIGGGSGGLAASKEAASLGRKVAVCDYVTPTPIGTTWGLGGTCVNVGCIPKKLMHKAALVHADFLDAPSFGWDMPENVKHNWSKMITKVQDHIKSLNFGYRKVLRENSVTYMNVYAQFCDSRDPHKINITDKKNFSKEITAQNFIIAVGGRPRYLDIPGAKEYGITSDDLFSLPYFPGKTLIVGASYVALECAGFLAGLGLEVTVMVRSILLRGFDQEIAEMIATHMSTHGVKFIRGCVPTTIEKITEDTPGILKVYGKSNNDEIITGEYNTVIFAVGRQACTKDLGLETVGVKLNINSLKIICNEEERSSVHNIFAIGDVLDGKPELTPVAIKAGRLLAKRLYGKGTTLMDYTNVSTTVFTPMEYGCIGLSEEAAVIKHGEANVIVYHNHFQPLEYALSNRDTNVPYSKLVCLKNEQERVVGLHVLSPNAGEIAQGFAIAFKLGAKKCDFDNLIGIYPTCGEIFTAMHTSKPSGHVC